MSTVANQPDNAAARAALLESHRPALQRYVVRLLGGDAVQAKTLIDAVAGEWKTLSPEEAGENPVEWLFATCRSRGLGRSGASSQSKAPWNDEASGNAGAPEGVAEAEEPHVTMQRLISRLTPKQQEAIRLRFQNDFSVPEIARITELTAYNVGVLVHHAVAKVGEAYRAQHPAPAGTESKGAGDDSRLTLYALGEMEDAERTSYEDSLIDKKNASLRVEEVRAIGALIGQALAIEAGAPAPRTVRKKKNSGLALWFRFPRVLFVIAGVVAVGLMIFFWLKESDEPRSSGPREKLDFRLKPADWKDGDPLPDEVPKKEGRGVGAGNASPSDRPGTNKSGRVKNRLAGKPTLVDRAGSLPEDNEIEGENVSDGQMSEADEATHEETLREGGIPTGAVPTGVAAVLRGQRGEIQPGQQAVASGAEGERQNFSEHEAAQPDAKEVAVAAAKPEVVKAEAKRADRAKQKPAATAAKGQAARPEKAFASPRDAGVSKLLPEVAATSVAALKKALRNGRRPAPQSVKTEELLNYFPLPSVTPEGSALFAATLEATEAPWNPRRRLVRVSLKGKAAPVPVRGAASLVLLLDISGSMEAPNRLPLVKEAVRLLLGRLRPDDRVGVVTYAAEPRLALLPTRVEQLQEIMQTIDQLEAQGPTNGGAGLELAYDLAKAHAAAGGVSCVIMCTDGDFNSGPTREEELGKIVDRQANSGVRLSIYGFGRGRQIDARLEKLALRGGGSSGYVNTRREAERVLTGEINGIFTPLAKELEMKVIFNPAQVEGYRLLGYDEPPEFITKKSNLAELDNRTVLPGHTFTALYEIIPVPPTNEGPPEGDLLKVQLNYRTPADGAPQQQEFGLRDRGAKFAVASRDFKFAAAVGAFGLVLSEQAPEGMTLDTVEAWAKESLGDDTGGYQSEFLSLVEQAKVATK